MVDSESAALKIRTLGVFQVERAGVEIPDDAWPRNKTRDLFKVLLTAPGDVFTVDQLIESLLPDAEVDRATSNIRARISELRSVLEPDLKRGTHSQYIKHVGEGYAFRLDSDCWVDAPAFESGLAEAYRLSDRGSGKRPSRHSRMPSPSTMATSSPRTATQSGRKALVGNCVSGTSRV